MSDPSYFGWAGQTANSSDFSAQAFHIQQHIAQIRTAVPVRIVAVHGGGVNGSPTVDVQPMVAQIDGQGNRTPHGIVYGLPVMRSQGGTAGVIMDPVVGDVGHLIISDRDTSALRSNEGAESNPGSFRMHDLADGVYHGAAFGVITLERYINLNGPGISISDEFGNTITTGADGVMINGLKIDRDSNLTTPGGIQAGTGTGDSVTLQHHKHGGGPPPDPGT